jgi:hypothetical protein
MNVEAGRKHRSDQLDLSSQPQAWLPAVDACLGPAAGTTDRSAKRISIVPNARWWPPPVHAVLFNLPRRRLQRAVNRRFHRLA